MYAASFDTITGNGYDIWPGEGRALELWIYWFEPPQKLIQVQ